MARNTQIKTRFQYRIWKSFVEKRYTGWRETNDIHSVLKRYDCDDELFDTAVEGAVFLAEVSGRTHVLTKLYYSWNRNRSLYRNLQVMIIAEPALTFDDGDTTDKKTFNDDRENNH